ncbi:GntR family transcriptional regulator [Tengunoibacter tsumagoiensis]|uniref:HTH-type transcriptional repressor YvoA n=1 Tax=Tengunoibacter tsumagoiensis TaxID=2014871 RepID=A0A402A410_9CHLR|nr:GntR family transcriptional regulator [Tengunoibacter tsumagoiensis]GCE13860.1 HTH-type transcriptional repressor YvoA [Tengunoibacter tsumagoiensis]
MEHIYLNQQSDVPLYLQLKENLREQIRAGVWQVGERLPSEQALHEQLAVSRATVRQALAELEREGYLSREHGRGTFVSKPKIAMRLSSVYSFTLDIEAKGMQAETRIVLFEYVIRRPEISALLGVSEHEPLIKLVRLRLADQEPIMLETTYLPEQLVPGLSEHDVATNSLYSILEQRYGMQPTSALESFEPILTDEFAAKMLGVPQGAPALYVERLGSLGDGRKVELTQSIVRGDRCRYFVELS